MTLLRIVSPAPMAGFWLNPAKSNALKGSTLRSMFLPRLTSAGSRILARYYASNFVRGKLKHYGVQFNESEISRNRTILLKKAIKAGNCDIVPDHLVRLREQIHREWLNTRTPERLSGAPNWILERYFLSSDQPDCTKTTTVVGIPLDRHSTYRASQMREIAAKVAGLHEQSRFGAETQTVFLGCDPIAVSKAAKGHAAKKAKKLQAVKNKRNR